MRGISWGTHALFGLGALLLVTASAKTLAQVADSADTVTLLWTERKPFQYADEKGQPQGILVEIGRMIFDHADIKVRPEVVPANRVIKLLEYNEQSICAVGWYKSAEREAIAQFTAPVYRDKPLRGVFRADAEVANGTTAAALFNDQKTRPLLKFGFAYGPVLDELIARKGPALVERASAETPSMLLMLKAKRADFLLLSQEEIDYYNRTDPNFYANFKIVVFGDLPPQDWRYIMCSKRVPSPTMNRLNDAIAATIKLK